MWINIERYCIAFMAIISIVGCSRDPADAVAAKLQSADIDDRRAATRELVERPLNDERIIGALTRSIADQDADVRHAAIDALGKLGSNASVAVPALKTTLQDPVPTIRIRAAFAIARIDPRDRSSFPVLIAEMRVGDGRTLLEVASLGSNAAWAAPTLTELLAHPSPKVRTLAANALGSIGPAAASSTTALARTTKDGDAVVRRAAQQALERVSPTKDRAAFNQGAVR